MTFPTTQEQIELMNAEVTTVEQLYQIFSTEDGASELIEKITTAAHAAAEGIDHATDKGRKELKSIARQVASVKTRLDEQGKMFTNDLAKRKAIFDNNRKTIRDELDKVRDEIKLPATQYEEEQARIKAVSEAVLSELQSFGQFVDENGNMLSSEELKQRMSRTLEIETTPYQYLQSDIDSLVVTTKAILANAIKMAENQEETMRKLAEAEAAAAAKEKELHDEKIRQEAKAAAERENAEREAKMAAELEKAKKEAQEAKERAEAEAKAKVEAQAKAEAEAKAKAAADEENQRRVNNSILSKLTELGVTRPVAIAIIEAVINGEIPNLDIDYSK